MSASDDMTDAVAEARRGFAEQRYSPEGIVGRLVARIEDLESRVEAVRALLQDPENYTMQCQECAIGPKIAAALLKGER